MVQAVLNHAGYTPEVSHRVLVEMAEHRKELEKKTKPILDTLRSYQDLPPVFRASHAFCLLQFLEYCRTMLCLFLFLLLVGIVQDKALAALAIEDKKRQYAAAEKYLEDVLQSALANSG